VAEYEWHEGEHEYEDGYGDDGQEVRCVLCAQAKREYNRLPSLEVPAPGRECSVCRSQLVLDDPPFCGVCEEAQKPMTLDQFLAYAVNSCVNGTSK
jgi:hypothetical protein